MNKDKETKKLGAEELEKRVAPFTIYNQDGTTTTTDSSTGTKTGTKDTTSGSGGTKSGGPVDKTV